MGQTTSLRLRVQSRLVELGLSKTNLCGMVGRPPRWLSDVLAGRQGLTEKAIKELAEALGVPTSFFAEEVSARLAAPARNPKQKQELG